MSQQNRERLAFVFMALLCLRSGTLGAGHSSAGSDSDKSRVDQYGDPLPAHARTRLGTSRLQHLVPEGNSIVANGTILTRLAFSPDGKWLASLAAGGSVCLWDASTGRLERRFGDRTTNYSDVDLAFAPDNRTLAVRIGRTTLWDAITGKQVLTGHPGQHTPGAQTIFAADGKTFAVVSQNEICVREVGTDKDIRKLEGIKGKRLNAAAFSSDGRTLVCSDGFGQNDVVHVWNVATGKERCRIEGLQFFESYHIALSPEGRFLATGGSPSQGKAIRLWDLGTAKNVGTFQGQLPVRFSPDSATLLCLNGKHLTFYETVTGKPIRVLEDSPVEYDARQGRPQAFAVSNDRQRIAIAGNGGNIRVLDAITGKDIIPANGHGRIGFVAWRDAGKQLVTAGSDLTVRLWDKSDGKELRRFRVAPDELLSSAALSSDGKTLAIGGYRGVQVYDVATGQEIRRHATWEIGGLAFTPDGKRLAATGNGAWIWDVTSGEELKRFQGLGGRGTVFSPDGKVLVTEGVRIWDAATGKELRRLGRGRLDSPFALSRDGQTVAAKIEEFGRDVAIYDLPTGRMKTVFPMPPAHRLAFSPDAKLLVGAASPVIPLGESGAPILDYSLIVWDVASGEEVLRLPGHRARITCLSFLDGKTLASASEDSTVLVWDLPTLNVPARSTRPINELSAPGVAEQRLSVVSGNQSPGSPSAAPDSRRLRHPGPVGRVTFSPDGKMLVSSSEFTVCGWDVTSGKELVRLNDRGFHSFGDVFFVKDSQILVTHDRGNKLVFTDIVSGKDVRTIRGERGLAIPNFALSSNGKLLAYSSGNLRIILIDLATGKELARIANGNGPYRFSPDGKSLWIRGRAWDVSKGAWDPSAPIASGSIKNEGLSPCGKRLAVNYGGSVRISDTATGKELHRFTVDTKDVLRIVFSPDSKLLALKARGVGGWLVDVSTGKEIGRFPGYSNPGDITFSPDGKLLAVGDGYGPNEGGILIWDVSERKLLHRGEQ
jgi:WD40 repeat protein